MHGGLKRGRESAVTHTNRIGQISGKQSLVCLSKYKLNTIKANKEGKHRVWSKERNKKGVHIHLQQWQQNQKEKGLLWLWDAQGWQGIGLFQPC
jgi:hypothetical protein